MGMRGGVRGEGKSGNKEKTRTSKSGHSPKLGGDRLRTKTTGGGRTARGLARFRTITTHREGNPKSGGVKGPFTILHRGKNQKKESGGPKRYDGRLRVPLKIPGHYVIAGKLLTLCMTEDR